MFRILIIITILFIPVISMSQTQTFSKAVQQLYFNVDVKKSSIITIINELKNVANEYNVSNGISSLSINLDMDMSGNAKKVSHIFIYFI